VVEDDEEIEELGEDRGDESADLSGKGSPFVCDVAGPRDKKGKEGNRIASFWLKVEDAMFLTAISERVTGDLSSAKDW